ncbi:hypothetical protein PMAYCL1PPCAC_25645, partial [Pristionchus mayeri]
RIPFATPEQIEEFVRAKKLRAASNRRGAAKNTSDVPSSHPTTTTTARAPANTKRSTVIPSSSTGEGKIRVKRDERRRLPGNGMTEAQRKSAAVVVDSKKEEKEAEKKVEEKKEEEIEKEKVEVKETTLAPSHNETVKKEKIEEKETKAGEKKEEQKSVHSVTEKTEEMKIDSTTQAANIEKKEEKGDMAAKVEIPVATEAPKEVNHDDEKKSDDKTAEPHHTVKKDLKAHVQEPVKVE